MGIARDAHWGVRTLRRSIRLARLSVAGIALAGAVALGGCETDDISPTGARALRPLPAALAAEMEKKNMPKESPILVRIFKEEAELEVWKQDAEGQYALLKTYPICRWSGELGPKVKEGDRQAPEGFYNITPGQMNPNSNYYLAFNLGFPNAYDRANDRTGAFLMVHGDCSSRGCYAMTDEQIQEIYAMGRDSFMGGQKSFQVQAYPFRMTPLNMAKHRNNPNMAFWRMIKEGNDHFLVTKAEPQVDVCEKHYVFNARTAPNTTPVTLHPRDKCPVYEVAPEIAAAVKEKQDADERAFTEYANRGIATVAVRTGTDGGMHPAFLAKLKPRSLIDFDRLTGASSDVKAPDGPLPPNANPPRAPDSDATSAFAAAPAPTHTVAAAAETPSESTFQKMGRWFGFGSNDAPPTTVAATTKPKPTQTAAGAPKPVHPPPAPAATPAAKPKSQVEVAHAASPAPAAPAAPSPPPANPGVMAGAAPVVPSGSFESRWGGMQ
jgi:murein L,D-transpeptidase YafK